MIESSVCTKLLDQQELRKLAEICGCSCVGVEKLQI